MRIGYVLKRYPRYSETFIRNEIAAHEAAGLEIEIFSLRPLEDEQFQQPMIPVRASVTNLPVPSRKDLPQALTETEKTLPDLSTSLAWAGGEKPRNLIQALQLAREVRAKSIDHLHAHFASVATTVARLAARFAGVSYTFTAHAKDIFHESVQYVDLRKKLMDAAATITVSDYNHDYLKNTYGSAAARVRRVYNGLDLKEFPYHEPRQRPPHIASVGRLVEKKGFRVLLEACAILLKRDCPFRCWIIGSGALEKDLRLRIEQLGLQERVELLGSVPQSEVTRQIIEASLLALPCTVASNGDRDGLPTVLLEAMALGTPCVSSDVTGIPEILQDEVTGLAVPRDDPEALAVALERLLYEDELRILMSRRARQLIEMNHDIHPNAAQIRSIFEEVVGRNLDKRRARRQARLNWVQTG